MAGIILSRTKVLTNSHFLYIWFTKPKYSEQNIKIHQANISQTQHTNQMHNTHTHTHTKAYPPPQYDTHTIHYCLCKFKKINSLDLNVFSGSENRTLDSIVSKSNKDIHGRARQCNMQFYTENENNLKY